jgi:hypothetical protein
MNDDHSAPTWDNQLWHARKDSGPTALYNPHAMIGKSCGCNDCFCCAALWIHTHEYKGFWNKPVAA